MVKRILSHISNALGVKSGDGEDYQIGDMDLQGVDIFHEKVDRWVTPITLKVLDDTSMIKHELSQGNVVLLDMKYVSKMQRRSKEALLELKKFCVANNGDMARITEHKFMLTPSKVRIVKRKR
ncbi:MAG: cell division protein SepF [Candidatus Micrarchaeota archaeon]